MPTAAPMPWVCHHCPSEMKTTNEVSAGRLTCFDLDVKMFSLAIMCGEQSERSRYGNGREEHSEAHKTGG